MFLFYWCFIIACEMSASSNRLFDVKLCLFISLKAKPAFVSAASCFNWGSALLSSFEESSLLFWRMMSKQAKALTETSKSLKSTKVIKLKHFFLPFLLAYLFAVQPLSRLSELCAKQYSKVGCVLPIWEEFSKVPGCPQVFWEQGS